MENNKLTQNQKFLMKKYSVEFSEYTSYEEAQKLIKKAIEETDKFKQHLKGNDSKKLEKVTLIVKF